MRWKTNTRPSSPTAGDIRIVTFFVWLPTQMPDGNTYWLTKVTVEQEWDYDFEYYFWRNKRILEKDDAIFVAEFLAECESKKQIKKEKSEQEAEKRREGSDQREYERLKEKYGGV